METKKSVDNIYLKLSLNRKDWYTVTLDQSSKFAMNIAVSDIKNFSKREGSGTKTIKINGTKENNITLKSLFDVKSTDLTFVRKKVWCQVIKNDFLLLDNLYFIIESMTLTGNTNVNQDFSVSYTAKIFNDLTNFYQSLDALYLTDLDLSEYNHPYNSQTIVNSFTNTSTNGYKYFLHYPYSSDSYLTKDFFPAIFTKTYFDKIHSNAGYRYTFPEMNNSNIRFDKLIHPWVGDLKKLVKDEYSSLNSIARRNVNQLNTITTNFPTGSNGLKIYNQSAYNLTNNTTVQPTQKTDENNLWNLTSFRYKSPATFVSPSTLNFNMVLNYEVYVQNNINQQLINWKGGSSSQTRETQNAITAWLEVINITKNNTVIFSKRIDPSKIEKGGHSTNVDCVRDYYNKWYLNGPIIVNANAKKVLYSSNNQNISIDLPLSNISYNDELIFRIRFNHYSEDDWNSCFRAVNINNNLAVMDHSFVFNLKSFTITQTITTDNYLIGPDLPINKFIPSGIKQTDYLLSIMRMFNLYAEPDPNDERNIIYKTRDYYYETGNDLGDLTHLVDYSKSINVVYLNDLNQRRIVLTYKKDDKDTAIKQYIDTTEEIPAQQEIILDNENVKGTITQELIFAPSLNVQTPFNANVPLYPVAPNMNMKILLDNGLKSCDNFNVKDGNNVNVYTRNKYPFVSMQDDITNPSFSIEYGPSEYYLHSTNYTNNNLYWNHYANQMQQINTSSLVTLYMKLSDSLISKLRMNDRFTINNKQYYFNRIIDYQPNVTYTKVEIMSADDVLFTPKVIKKPGGTITKPDVPLYDVGVVISNSVGDIISISFDANINNEDVNVVADNTVFDVLIDDTNEPVIGGTIYVDGGIANSKNPIDVLTKNQNDFWAKENINSRPTNTILGDKNMVAEGVTNTIIVGNEKVAAKSNSVYTDNIETETFNTLPVQPLINILTPPNDFPSITYAELAALNFTSGVYYIEDRDIYVRRDNVKTEFWRNVSVPDLSFYPTGNESVNIWHSSKTVNVDDLMIHGNNIFRNLTGNIGTETSNDMLDTVNWVLDEEATTVNYKLNIEYSIEEDKLISAYDPIKNNLITELYIYDYSYVTDWNHPQFINNTAKYGIFNNATNVIKDNITKGEINNNKTTEITDNIAKTIKDNNITGGISKNTATGEIKNLTSIVNDVKYNVVNDITNPTLISGDILGTIVNK